jgi:hypothetical protein
MLDPAFMRLSKAKWLKKPARQAESHSGLVPVRLDPCRAPKMLPALLVRFFRPKWLESRARQAESPFGLRRGLSWQAQSLAGLQS